MAKLRAAELKFINDLISYPNGLGYVFDFTDPSFSDFFQSELSVAIDDHQWSINGGSKGKRLNEFIRRSDASAIVGLLEGLKEYRIYMIATFSDPDPFPTADQQLEKIISRLSLDERKTQSHEVRKNQFDYTTLGNTFADLYPLAPQKRGFEFEKFLNQVFEEFGLIPRASFRNIGEQIDGSFVLEGETYLLEAKWQSATGSRDLNAFEAQVNNKAAWARGLFVSYAGFTDTGLSAFGKAKKTICMDGLDFHHAFEKQIPINEVLQAKVRRAAENSDPYTRVSNLFP